MYLLKLSLRPWRQSPYSQVFTAFAVGILLFLSAFLFWMQKGLRPVVDRLQNEQVITAYLDPSLNAKDETDVVDTIRSTVGSHAEVELVGTDQFLARLRSDYPELASELEDLGAEMQTVIPRFVSVTGLLSLTTLGQVRGIRGVQSAESSVDRFRNVIGAFRALRWISTLLALGLALALMTALIHLGRTNAYLHQGTFSLMKLMGAGQAALRAPGIASGASVGLLGGIFAALGWIALAASMAGHVREFSPILSVMPGVGGSFVPGLLIAGAVLGGCAGLLGNWLGAERSSGGYSPRAAIRASGG